MSRLITTLLVIGVVIGFVLAATGVLHFQNTTDEATITINKKELKEKTQEVIKETGEAGGKMLDRTSETLHKAAEGMRPSPENQTTPSKSPAADRENSR
jgi:hypothetical protein